MRSAILARILLVAALLFAQVGSLAHGISHVAAGQPTGQDQSVPHEKFCDQCAAYAQIGGVIGSNGVILALHGTCETLNQGGFSSHTASRICAFFARAPPYLS
jgi:hypothetical protein